MIQAKATPVSDGTRLDDACPERARRCRNAFVSRKMQGDSVAGPFPGECSASAVDSDGFACGEPDAAVVPDPDALACPIRGPSMIPQTGPTSSIGCTSSPTALTVVGMVESIVVDISDGNFASVVPFCV